MNWTLPISFLKVNQEPSVHNDSSHSFAMDKKGMVMFKAKRGEATIFRWEQVMNCPIWV